MYKITTATLIIASLFLSGCTVNQKQSLTNTSEGKTPTESTASTTRILIKRNEINKNYELPIYCIPEKVDRLHLNEEFTEWVTYKNPERGLEMSIPYNPRWGDPDFYLNPYDEYDDSLAFGNLTPPHAEHGCDNDWVPDYEIKFLPAESKDLLIKRLKQTYPNVTSRTVDSKEYVSYDDGTEYRFGGHVIMGEKYNYQFISQGPAGIKNLRFIK